MCKTDIANDIFIAFGGDGKVIMLMDLRLNIHFNVILIQLYSIQHVTARAPLAKEKEFVNYNHLQLLRNCLLFLLS